MYNLDLPKHIVSAIHEITCIVFDPDISARVGAVLTKGGKIVSVGTNSLRHSSYPMRYIYREDIKSLHAEVSVILQARKKIDLCGSKLWVARLKRTGEVGLSKPCPMCQEIIARYGIKRVHYTVDDETYATWRVPQIDIKRKTKQLTTISSSFAKQLHQ